MNTLLIMLTLAFGSTHAFGQELKALYRSSTASFIAQLEGVGIKQVACQNSLELNKPTCLSLRDLSRMLDRVQFVELPTFNKPFSSQRMSAFNYPPKKKIYLNASVVHEKALIGAMGFHELLSVYGFADDEFEITMSAYLLVSKRSQDQTNARENFLRNRVAGRDLLAETPGWSVQREELVLADGGFILVGGGGDFETLKIRIFIYDQTLRSLENTPHDGSFFTPIIDLPILGPHGPVFEPRKRENGDIIYFRIRLNRARLGMESEKESLLRFYRSIFASSLQIWDNPDVRDPRAMELYWCSEKGELKGTTVCGGDRVPKFLFFRPGEFSVTDISEVLPEEPPADE